MSADRAQGPAVPPGTVLQEELTARGWTTSELASRMGGDPQVNQLAVDFLIHCPAVRVDPESAQGLGRALGTSAEFWLALDQRWQERKAGKSGPASTPGPWTLAPLEPRELHLKRECWQVGQENGERFGVAIVFGPDGGNARLISAAPELADALEELLALSPATYCVFCDRPAPQISGPTCGRDETEEPVRYGPIQHRPACPAEVARKALRKAGRLQ